jgi:ketosteroid isomerase-like protein
MMGIFKREEKKVRETIELYANAFIDKDIDMLMSLVALDEDFLLINQKPYEKVIGAKKFYHVMKDFIGVADEIDISINWMFLSVIDNMSWVNSEMLFNIKKARRVIEESRSVTFILEKRRGDWYIVHIINSVIDTTEADEPAEENIVCEETGVYEFDKDEKSSEKDETAEDTD